MDFFNNKTAALLSIISNSFLIITKLIVGIISGSVSILSEAIHSFTDLLASFMAYYSVRESAKPADLEHQYGHGKFEDLSGGAEGALIILAACYIVYEALHKIKHGFAAEINTTVGILVMLFSVVINLIISSYLFKVAKKNDSIAILADAQHLRTDVYTSLGVLIGLVIVRFTHQPVLDPLIAIFVALMIFKAGYTLTKDAVQNLLDVSLPVEEKDLIKSVINKYTSEHIVEFQKFKTRKAGPKRLIEFTLIVPASMTIKEGHDICDKMEAELENIVRNVDVTIHLEPCNGECLGCILYHKSLSICKK